MFIYLSKKIGIPQGVQLHVLSWNSEQGWIACGGDNGLLKVLKLEAGRLPMNQTLDGHKQDALSVITWNENYRKLSTSDENGCIIVWTLHKGMWYEEMINNRNESVVKDMKWTTDGKKICIVYEDGTVIVGSVDGNRLWGQQLDTELALVHWSPDGSKILFGTSDSQVHVYDNLGNFIYKVNIYANNNVNDGSDRSLCSLEWFSGMQAGGADTPKLALCFRNGRCQVMRDFTDDNPVLIDTGMVTNGLKWNTHGTVMAISGTQTQSMPNGEQKETHMCQFYTPNGKHLRTLRVPGGGITSISWEGGSLRLALAVDSHIYFANVRPDYDWAYFANTVVYSFVKPDRAENCVCFWDTVTDEKYVKYVKQLIAIRAAGENCVFATRPDTSGQYILILCNCIGSPVDSKYIDVEPQFLAMTEFHVIVASTEQVYVWQYRTPVSKLTSLTKNTAASRLKDGREHIFHIDEVNNITGTASNRGTNDPICCVTASKNALIIGRTSGSMLRLSLPSLVLENKYNLKCRPQLLALNCNSTRVSIIDINGIARLFDLDARPEGNSGPVGQQLQFERKDAWDMLWSEDNPSLFACMEKTKMYVFRDLDPEEPVMSNGYLCSFKDLCIKAILMDDVMADPEHPQKNFVVDHDTKSLRDTRDLLSSVPISEAFQFIEDNPHPRLWRLLSETALEQLNFVVADKAFVRCSDYQGIQFVKRLKIMNNRKHQRAEVAAYFRHFDEAENIYLNEMDSKDLAIELRIRLGDWFRVVQLIQSGGGDDRLLRTAYNNIGDYYADRQKWQKAFKYYSKAKNYKEMAQCAYILDDYESLETFIQQMPEGSEHLKAVGDMFMSVGLCPEAVSALLKAGEPKAAIDCCVLLNQWDMAVELAEKHKFQQIEGLLSKYATHLLAKKKLFQAVELYRKAGKHSEAAKLLSQIAQDALKKNPNPLRSKKLYVLSALEIDQMKHKLLGGGGQTMSTQQTLQSLMEHDATTSSLDGGMEDPWKGAEGFHFHLLCQRHLYMKDWEAALKTATRLTDYEMYVNPKEIYSLLALAGFFTKHFGICSKALGRLETMDTLSEEERAKYSSLALSIFTINKPKDPKARKYPCPSNTCDGQVSSFDASCGTCLKSIPACIVTGQPINGQKMHSCRVCKRRMLESEIRKYMNCPLCHSMLR